MIRLLLHVFKIRDYESCKSCETLKNQLRFVNAEKMELMETLIQLTRPKVVIPSGEPKILNPLQQAGGTFARRRSVLEDMHRKRDDTIQTSPFIANPDDVKPEPKKHITMETIESLEKKLGFADET